MASEFFEVVRHALVCLDAPKTGMQVPYLGDFASAPPSVRRTLMWWLREWDATATAQPDARDAEIARLREERDFERGQRDLRHAAYIEERDKAARLTSFIRALGGDGECVILASKRFAEMLADEVDPAPTSPSAAQRLSRRSRDERRELGGLSKENEK